MTLPLSPSDRALLHRALHVLASPLEYTSASAWRDDALQAMLPLFAADAGVFVLPHEAEPAASLLNRPEGFFLDYIAHQSSDRLVDVWRAAGFGATTIESLTQGNRARFTSTEVYTEVYRPHGVEDIVACVVDLVDHAPQVGPRLYFAPGGVPMRGAVALLSDRPHRERFGAAGLELMRLLHPALRAAGRTWQRLSSQRRSLLTLIDGASDGLALFGPTGRLLHQNPAFARLLEGDAHPETLMAAAARAAKSLGRLLWASGSDDGADGAFEREIDTGGHLYSVRATRAESVFGKGGAILVMVQPQTPRLPRIAALARQHGLTRREAQIAELLANGATNKQIVAQFGFTEHTARRHTENVMRKLGLNSRAQVAALLHGGGR